MPSCPSSLSLTGRPLPRRLARPHPRRPNPAPLRPLPPASLLPPRSCAWGCSQQATMVWHRAAGAASCGARSAASSCRPSPRQPTTAATSTRRSGAWQERALGAERGCTYIPRTGLCPRPSTPAACPAAASQPGSSAGRLSRPYPMAPPSVHPCPGPRSGLELCKNGTDY